MTIDCTLDNLKIPALPTYSNEFGTKKPTGGLTTAECTDDAMLPFRKMRPYEINEDSETTEIQHNAVFVAKAANITLTLHDCSDSFLGCEARVINVSSGSVTVKGGVSGIDGGTAGITVPAKREVRLIFLSDGWHSSYDNYCNITEKEIASSAVTTDKIANASVTTTKIADKSVTEGKIAANAVTTAKIKDASVTTDKIANASVTNSKIGETLFIKNGGTGATTATQAINNLAVGLEEATAVPTDAMGFITTDANNININASDSKIYKRSGSKVWEWIKSKIETVLGLGKGSLTTKTITATSVTATEFKGNLKGNADSATYATTVVDYGNSSKRIKIGYAGESLSTCRFLAAYNNDGTAIKDISPDSVTVGKATSAGNADTVDGHHFNWTGKPGQPGWLWGGNDSANQYVYNPINFSVNYANSAGSVAWGNVSGKPAYVTGSYSPSNGILNLTINNKS